VKPVNADFDSATSNRKAILLMCLGVLMLVLNDTSAKWLVDRYDPFQMTFIRSVITLPMITVVILMKDGLKGMGTKRFGPHALRGLFIMAATFCFFNALKALSLADATALFFAAPMFITALSVPLLGDKVGPRRWSAVIAGFIGVIIIVRPSAETFQPGSLFAVATALVYAFIMISSRWLHSGDNMRTVVFYMSLLPAIYASFVLFGEWPVITGSDFAVFVAMAIFWSVGVAIVSEAFRSAPAAVVAPFDYTALIWASVIGWLIWGTIPDMTTYLGAVIIAASGIYILFRQEKLKP
jgi:drug/metabolite transporter (DMT)-like permease